VIRKSEDANAKAPAEGLQDRQAKSGGQKRSQVLQRTPPRPKRLACEEKRAGRTAWVCLRRRRWSLSRKRRRRKDGNWVPRSDASCRGRIHPAAGGARFTAEVPEARVPETDSTAVPLDISPEEIAAIKAAAEVTERGARPCASAARSCDGRASPVGSGPEEAPEESGVPRIVESAPQRCASRSTKDGFSALDRGSRRTDTSRTGQFRWNVRCKRRTGQCRQPPPRQRRSIPTT